MMSEFRTLRAGVFLSAVFIPTTRTRSLCMERDYQLMQCLDAHNHAEARLAIWRLRDLQPALIVYRHPLSAPGTSNLVLG
jgi:hypothetical protein